MLHTRVRTPGCIRSLGTNIHYTRFSFREAFVMNQESCVFDWVWGRGEVSGINTVCVNGWQYGLNQDYKTAYGCEEVWLRCPRNQSAGSREPREDSAEHSACALKDFRHLHPQGGMEAQRPSPGPYGTSFQGSTETVWAEQMAWRAKPHTTLSWVSCRILRPSKLKGRVRRFKVRYRTSW